MCTMYIAQGIHRLVALGLTVIQNYTTYHLRDQIRLITINQQELSSEMILSA